MIAFLLALSACDSGEGGNANAACDGSGDRVLTARVDGEAFCAPVSNATSAFGQIFLTAPSADARQVISFGFPATVGTHDLQNVATYVPVVTGTVSYEASSGSVTVTEVSETRVRGTFAFMGAGRDLETGASVGGTRTVTDGEFDVVIDGVMP